MDLPEEVQRIQFLGICSKAHSEVAKILLDNNYQANVIVAIFSSFMADLACQQDFPNLAYQDILKTLNETFENYYEKSQEKKKDCER